LKFVLIVAAYLLGSCSWSVWIGKWFYGIDVRDYGSGNAGATNTMRVLGTLPGLMVLILDALKGFAAVKLVYLSPAYADDIETMVLLGIVSVVGHIFPVFTNFKGGKGIATLLGMIIAIHAGAALMAMATFMFFFLTFRIVSLGSILAALSFPIWLIFRFHENSPILVIFSFALVFLVLITHQKNIERLLQGEEQKVRIRKERDDEV